MFLAAYAFNQPLNDWSTSNVTNMSMMFYATVAFNQPLNSWNTSNVTNMSSMFFYAYAFNQDISSWQVYNLTSHPYKPDGFDIGAIALFENSSYLPNWAMAAP
jgi:surface protein